MNDETKTKFLRKRDVAERMGVSTGQVDKWRRSGQLKAVEVEGSNMVRFLESDVDEFIAANVRRSKAD